MATKKGEEVKPTTIFLLIESVLRYFWTPGYGDRVNTCENGGKMKCVSMVFNRATVREDEMWHVGADPEKAEN